MVDLQTEQAKVEAAVREAIAEFRFAVLAHVLTYKHGFSIKSIMLPDKSTVVLG